MVNYQLRVFMKNILNVNEINFDREVVQSAEPVVVDFWAEWCGPCKMLAPVLEEAAKEMATSKIVKVNVEESPSLANRYGIRSIPTLLFVKNGEVREMNIGLLSKKALLAKVDALMEIPA